MNNTPDSPAKPPDDRMDQGGNYWTLFTPGIWKVLHAVLHRTAYPRPGVRLTREELGLRYDLTEAEIDFVRANARADTSRLLLAVLLKARRDFGCFPAPR